VNVRTYFPFVNITGGGDVNEDGTGTSYMTVTRDGGTSTKVLEDELSVKLDISGDASESDYQLQKDQAGVWSAVGDSVVIDQGSSSVWMRALGVDDNDFEAAQESAIIKIGKSQQYAIADTPPATTRVIEGDIWVDLTLSAAERIEAAPENEDYATEKAAAGGTDKLGPLELGQGRHEQTALVYATMVVGEVRNPKPLPNIPLRWRRSIRVRSWGLASGGQNNYIVVQNPDGKRGFPEPADDMLTDTGAGNDPSPSENKKIYIYDNSGLGVKNNLEVGDFVYTEKQFVYWVECNVGGEWKRCSDELKLKQVAAMKRVAKTNGAAADWQEVTNTLSTGTIDCTITERDAKGIVGGTATIVLDEHAND